MEVKAFTLYPDYAISPGESEGLSKWKLRCLQEEKIKMVRQDIEATKSIRTTTKYFIQLPSIRSSTLRPPNWKAWSVCTEVTPICFQKMDMVQAGITEVTEIKHALKYYVESTPSKEIGRKPIPGDRAFYPLYDDIRNHVGNLARSGPFSHFYGGPKVSARSRD